MRKLSLSLDDLAVESFATADDAIVKRGTIKGREDNTDLFGCGPTEYFTACGQYTCNQAAATCNGGESCGGTCDRGTCYPCFYSEGPVNTCYQTCAGQFGCGTGYGAPTCDPAC